MKKVLGGVALTLGLGIWCAMPPATAREGGEGKNPPTAPQPEEADKLLKAMTEHLQLTQAQQGKIKPVLSDMVAQINALKSGPPSPGKHEKAAAIRKTAFDKVAAELTPEQKAKFDKHRAGMENGGKRQEPKNKPH